MNLVKLSRLAAKINRGAPERFDKKGGAAIYDQARVLAKQAKGKGENCGAIFFAIVIGPPANEAKQNGTLFIRK